MKPIVAILFAAFLATAMLTPSIGKAENVRVAKSMAALKDQTEKLGAPRIEGTDAVGYKDAPALYFGSTKMNNNNAVVDAVAKEGGIGMAATLFVKSGDEYIRVATTFPTATELGAQSEPVGTMAARVPDLSKRANHGPARQRFSVLLTAPHTI